MQREPYPLPVIRRQDYDAMRSLNGSDLPNTYDEWFKLFAKERLERNQVGFDVREIQINPDEFGRYCGARGVRADGKNILDFAAEKFAGNHY